ncbi:MAG: glycosyltransferase family 2 protein [Solobacterium sp.]|nr:glycosyltransferase family 2 protein [Solobacterium sp.]MBR0214260.1 glycosyltransferase family 2 protein [Solobacterium sp.]
MAQVTVVVPIYNVEKYVRACFESLLKQTSDDFVVLAVNDGSPDNSAQIISEFTARYPDRIKSITKENGGYGSVLQLAIKEMDTPYFIVCDPDDTLEPEAVETLLNLAQVSGADITIGAKMIMKEGSSIKEYDPSYNKQFTLLKSNRVYNRGTEEFDDLFFVNPSPHAKLYRREAAKDIVFPEKTGYTDNLLFYISLLNSGKVIYTDKPLANYLIDRTGNTMTDISYKAMNGQILVFRTIAEQAVKLENIPDIFWYRMFEAFKFMLYQTRRLNCTKEQYRETLEYLGTFLEMVTARQKEVKPYYKKYAKTAVIERMRDEGLLNPSLMNSVYSGIVRRMTNEFEEK